MHIQAVEATIRKHRLSLFLNNAVIRFCKAKSKAGFFGCIYLSTKERRYKTPAAMHTLVLLLCNLLYNNFLKGFELKSWKDESPRNDVEMLLGNKCARGWKRGCFSHFGWTFGPRPNYLTSHRYATKLDSLSKWVPWTLKTPGCQKPRLFHSKIYLPWYLMQLSVLNILWGLRSGCLIFTSRLLSITRLPLHTEQGNILAVSHEPIILM